MSTFTINTKLENFMFLRIDSLIVDVQLRLVSCLNRNLLWCMKSTCSHWNMKLTVVIICCSLWILTGDSLTLRSSPSQKLLKAVDDQSSIDQISRIVCSDIKNAQITKTSTIVQLAEYVESESEVCQKAHGKSIRILARLVKNGNKCSDQKLSLVEEYNSIAGKSRNKILDLFASLYFTNMSEDCKKFSDLSLSRRSLVESDNINEFFGHSSSLNEIDPLVAHFLGKLRSSDYKRIVIIWDLIENLTKIGWIRDSKHFSKYINTNQSERQFRVPVKIYIKTRSTEAIRGLQSKCGRLFRPIYSTTVLPVLRLLKLGYYSQVDAEMEDETVKSWLAIAQLCENILPIRFFANPQLASGRLIMVSKEEASELSKLEPQLSTLAEISDESESATFAPVEHFKLLTVEEAESVARNVESTLKARRLMFVELIKQMANYSKKIIAKKGRKLFAHLRSKHKKVETDFSDAIDNIQPEISGFSRAELENSVAADETRRQKRGIFKKIFIGLSLSIACVFIIFIAGVAMLSAGIALSLG